ncbi:MAG: APC family permease [Gammaproteobacteria bacterium]
MMQKKISVFSLFMIAVGSMVGSGWLFGAFYSAQIAGPAAILSWVLGAACAFVIAVIYAEISTMLPIAGGSVTYMRLSHGPFAGFMFAWITWLWTLIVPPLEAGAVVQYASNYIPGLIYMMDGVHRLTGLGIATAGVLLLFLTGINILGLNWLTKSNNLLTFFKLIVPLVVIALLIGASKFNFSHFSAEKTGGFMPYGLDGIVNALSKGAIVFSFFGFQAIIFLGKEADNPQKSIPLALFGGLTFCTILYILLQASFVMAVPDSALLHGWKNLTFEGDAGPFTGILIGLGFAWMVYVLNVNAIISPTGTGNAYVASASRILYSMGLQNDAPNWIVKLNRQKVPHIAIMVNFLVGMLFFLPFGGWQSMVAFLSAAIVLTLASAPLCLPIFRKIHPDLHRPFKVPAVYVSCFIAFYICNLLLFWAGWETLSKLIVAIAAGIIVYAISYALKWIPRSNNLSLTSFIWFPAYLLCSGLVSYYKPDIYMGFGYVALYSIVIYIWAQYSAISIKHGKAELAMITAKQPIL